MMPGRMLGLSGWISEKEEAWRRCPLSYDSTTRLRGAQTGKGRVLSCLIQLLHLCREKIPFRLGTIAVREDN